MIWIAHCINSAHIDKLRDISCDIIAVGEYRDTVLEKLLDRINSDFDYHDINETVTYSDFKSSTGLNPAEGEEFFDSEETGWTYTLVPYNGERISIV